MQMIIFLRGINVGGRVIKMAELKAAFEQAGYKKVITVLQTGNVIATGTETDIRKAETQIEKMLEKSFNYPAKVLVITADTLRAIVNAYPFERTDEFNAYCIFTKNGFGKQLFSQAPTLDATLEKIAEGHTVVYWTVKKGHTLDSAFGKYLEKQAGKEFTTNRNLNTLERVLKKTQ